MKAIGLCFGRRGADLFKFLKKFFLSARKPRRGFHEDFNNLVAAAVAPNVRNAFTFEAYPMTCLRPFGYLNFFGVLKGRTFYVCSKRGLDDRYRKAAINVVTIPDEGVMFFDLDKHIQIA